MLDFWKPLPIPWFWKDTFLHKMALEKDHEASSISDAH